MQGNYAICTGEGLKDKVTGKEKRLEDCRIRATHNPVVLLEGTKKGCVGEDWRWRAWGPSTEVWQEKVPLSPNSPTTLFPETFPLMLSTLWIWSLEHQESGHLSDQNWGTCLQRTLRETIINLSPRYSRSMQRTCIWGQESLVYKPDFSICYPYNFGQITYPAGTSMFLYVKWDNAIEKVFRGLNEML